jgi:hypothetical protein
MAVLFPSTVLIVGDTELNKRGETQNSNYYHPSWLWFANSEQVEKAGPRRECKSHTC